MIGDNQQLVSFLQFARTGRNKEVLAPADHDDQGVRRDSQFARGVTAFEHLLRHLHLPCRGLDLLRQVQIKVLEDLLLLGWYRQVQLTRHEGECHALREQGDDGAEEHHIEDDISIRHPFSLTHDGEDDGHGALESDPTEHQAVACTPSFERPHTQQHGHRTGDTDHHHTDDETRQPHVQTQELRRANHQTEHEEHRQLTEPSQTVEERLGLPFAGELTVTDDQTADIDGEISITLQVIGAGENEDTGREDHDGVQRFVGQFDAAHEQHESFA